MIGTLSLWIAALVFTPYGLLCWYDPGIAASAPGLSILRGDGYAELGGMYGGFQTGVGVFCGLATRRRHWRAGALALLALGLGALWLARLSSAFAATQPVSGYTWGALAFELFLAGLATRALISEERAGRG